MPHNIIKQELLNVLQGKILLVGIGNSLKADDGFGPMLIENLRDKVKAQCLDAGMSPENFIGKIIKARPDTVIFLDAVSFDGEPGELKFVKSDEIGEYGFSTHNMSPKLMIENIRAQIKTKIAMIGVQPKSVNFGEDISYEIKEKINLLETIFVELIGK